MASSFRGGKGMGGGEAVARQDGAQARGPGHVPGEGGMGARAADGEAAAVQIEQGPAHRAARRRGAATAHPARPRIGVTSGGRAEPSRAEISKSLRRTGWGATSFSAVRSTWRAMAIQNRSVPGQLGHGRASSGVGSSRVSPPNSVSTIPAS